jgi:hypothetical protein
VGKGTKEERQIEIVEQKAEKGLRRDNLRERCRLRKARAPSYRGLRPQQKQSVTSNGYDARIV